MFGWGIATLVYASMAMLFTSFSIGAIADERFTIRAHEYDFNTWEGSWRDFERNHFKWAAATFIFSGTALVGVFMTVVIMTAFMAVSSYLFEIAMTAIKGRAFKLFPSNFHYHFTIALYVFLSFVTCWIVASSKVGLLRRHYKNAWMNKRYLESSVK
jgi:hypothetical protein